MTRLLAADRGADEGTTKECHHPLAAAGRQVGRSSHGERTEEDEAINAFATAGISRFPTDEDKEKPKGSVKLKPRVVVFRGMMDKIIRTKDDKDLEAAADRLAYVLGHELSHITLGHAFRQFSDNLPWRIEAGSCSVCAILSRSERATAS
jgi:hypothetical protein